MERQETLDFVCAVCGKPPEYMVNLGKMFINHAPGRYYDGHELDFVPQPLCGECVKKVLDFEKINRVGNSLDHSYNAPSPLNDYEYMIEHFPFLKINHFTGHEISVFVTRLDYIELGWRRAFGLQLCQDIMDAFSKASRHRENFHDFNFGSWLRCLGRLIPLEVSLEDMINLTFVAGHKCKPPDEIADVILYYEEKSRHICCECGQPADYKVRLNDDYAKLNKVHPWEQSYFRPFCEHCTKLLLSIQPL